MRIVTRKSLDELAKVMPVLSEMEQRVYVGGTSGATGIVPSGGGVNDGNDSGVSANNYFSYSEYEARLASGTWYGGMVEGMGYVEMELTATPNGNSTSMNGQFVNAADLLVESNTDAQGNVLSGILNNLIRTGDGTSNILDEINAFWGDKELANYFQQNPNGQLYQVTKKYTSNIGVERNKVEYYDMNGRLVSVIFR